MNKALGLVEVRGLATAILVADTMVKTSNVQVVQPENTRGLGWITVKVLGDVGAVNAAVTSGKQIAIASGQYITSKVIPRPANSLDGFFGKDNTYSNKPKPKRSSSKKTTKKTPKQNKKAAGKSKNVKKEAPKQMEIPEQKNLEGAKLAAPQQIANPKPQPKNVEVNTKQPKKETPKEQPSSPKSTEVKMDGEKPSTKHEK